MFTDLKIDFIAGLKYALLFMGVSAIMGMIYGLFGLTIISPMFFAVALVAIFVILNFPFALIAFVLNIFPSFFKQGSRAVYRYFAYSFAFLIVFMLYFTAIKFSGVEPF